MKVDEVRQVSFTELGITGTPTLVLIDADGIVTNKWEGALSLEREGESFGPIERRHCPKTIEAVRRIKVHVW